MKYLNCFIFVMISVISSTLSMDVKKNTLVSLDERSKVFERYYLNDQTKVDPEIFDHMRDWHEADHAVLHKTVIHPDSHEKLDRVSCLIKTTFEAKTMTHSKLAAAYYLYSVILSLKSEQANAVDAVTDETFEKFFKQVVPYMQTGETPYTNSDKFWILFSRDKLGLRWLPFVSKSGLASFRTLNNQCGMKAPIMGVPLKRSSWDGYQDSTPAEFTHHEMRHGALMDSLTPNAIDPAYALYGQLNAIVRQITDTRKKLLCDYFLYELGHEYIFDIRPQGLSIIEIDIDLPYEFDMRKRPLLRSPLYKACNQRLKELEERHRNITVGLPLNNKWQEIKINPIDGQLGPRQSADEYYSTASLLKHFVLPGTQVLMSLEEMLIKHKHDLTKPISVHTLVEPFIPGLFPINFPGNIPSGLKDGLKIEDPFVYLEFERWYVGTLGVSEYNILIDLANYFKNEGELWKDGHFDPSSMIAIYKESHATFMQEVVSKTKEELATMILWRQG